MSTKRLFSFDQFKNEWDEDTASAASGVRPRRRLKQTQQFCSTQYDEHVLRNRPRCRVGEGFLCPSCSADLSYDAKQCHVCKFLCCYEAGVGVVILREREDSKVGPGAAAFHQTVVDETKKRPRESCESRGSTRLIRDGGGQNRKYGRIARRKSTHSVELKPSFEPNGDTQCNASNALEELKYEVMAEVSTYAESATDGESGGSAYYPDTSRSETSKAKLAPESYELYRSVDGGTATDTVPDETEDSKFHKLAREHQRALNTIQDLTAQTEIANQTISKLNSSVHDLTVERDSLIAKLAEAEKKLAEASQCKSEKLGEASPSQSKSAKDSSVVSPTSPSTVGLRERTESHLSRVNSCLAHLKSDGTELQSQISAMSDFLSGQHRNGQRAGKKSDHLAQATSVEEYLEEDAENLLTLAEESDQLENAAKTELSDLLHELLASTRSCKSNIKERQNTLQARGDIVARYKDLFVYVWNRLVLCSFYSSLTRRSLSNDREFGHVSKAGIEVHDSEDDDADEERLYQRGIRQRKQFAAQERLERLQYAEQLELELKQQSGESKDNYRALLCSNPVVFSYSHRKAFCQYDGCPFCHKNNESLKGVLLDDEMENFAVGARTEESPILMNTASKLKLLLPRVTLIDGFPYNPITTGKDV